MISRLGFAAALLLAALAGVVVGWGARRNIDRPPLPLLEPVATDRFGRLTNYPGKQVVPCPAQDESTQVLLVLGQSNAGNHGAARYVPRHAAAVLNFNQGRCVRAASPLLGATGRSGEYWSALGDALIDAGRAQRVVIVPFAVSGSRIARWQADGDLHTPLMSELIELNKHYRVTQVLWHQGEADFLASTSQEAYENSLKSLAAALNAAGIAAPLRVAVASRCLLVPWDPSNPVAQAQRRIASQGANLAAGPDADAVWSPEHRFDDCHLSAQGQAAMASGWLLTLR